MVAGLDGTLSLFAGAVILGVVHGAEPGHGWPIAAAYALDRKRTWVHGLVASSLLGLGHLVSSIAVVVVFFLAKDYFGLTQLGWVRYVAGVLLIGLGVREYRHGHSHDHSLGGDDAPDGHGDDDERDRSDEEHAHAHDGHPHDYDGHAHDHDGHGGDHERSNGHDHDHSHDHGHDHDHPHGHDRPHSHDHDHVAEADLDREGLVGIVGTAFVLGFAHEEEFEIIGLCLGSSYCLELMLAYAVAVLLALVALTALLIAGFERYGERVAGLADHLPTVSAVVLVALGLGFIVGVV